MFSKQEISPEGGESHVPQVPVSLDERSIQRAVRGISAEVEVDPKVSARVEGFKDDKFGKAWYTMYQEWKVMRDNPPESLSANVQEGFGKVAKALAGFWYARIDFAARHGHIIRKASTGLTRAEERDLEESFKPYKLLVGIESYPTSSIVDFGMAFQPGEYPFLPKVENKLYKRFNRELEEEEDPERKRELGIGIWLAWERYDELMAGEEEEPISF